MMLPQFYTPYTKTPDAAAHSLENKPLRVLVFEKMTQYFRQVNPDTPPRQLYELVLEEMERPLLEVVMKAMRNNQCKAAEVLGISRTNLRKKLKHYGMLQS